MNEIVAKSCPFCGNQPITIVTIDDHAIVFKIKCEKCRIGFSESIHINCYMELSVFDTLYKETKYKILNKWNARLGKECDKI